MRFNLAKIRQQKRQALAGPDDTNNPETHFVYANVRTGRRTAVLPMDNVAVDSSGGRYGSASSAAYGSDTDYSDVDQSRSSRHQSAVGVLPGLTEEEMTSLLSKNRNNDVDDDASEAESSENVSENVRPLLPGLDPAQMAAFLQRHGGNVDDDTDDDDADSVQAKQDVRFANVVNGDVVNVDEDDDEEGIELPTTDFDAI